MLINREKMQSIMHFVIGYILNFLSISTALSHLLKFWKIPLLSSVITILLYGGLLLAVLVGIAIQFTRRISVSRMFVISLLAVSWLITMLVYPENAKYMWTSVTDFTENPGYIFWLYSFSLLSFSGCIDDVDKLAKNLEKFAYVVIALNLLYYVVGTEKNTPPEYMNFSYSMQFSVALLMVLTLQKFSWGRLIFCAIGGVLIFVAGCRGALLGLLVSGFVFDFLNGKNRTFNQNVVRALLLLVCVLVLINWRAVLESIAEVLKVLKISSRTIQMMLDGSITEDSGRGILRETIWNELSLVGYGLYSDRYILGNRYVHNVFYELLLNYGMLLGAALFILWVIVIAQSLIKSKGSCRALICALLCSGFVKLFLSGSYLHWEPAVYLLLGLCIDGVRKQSSGANSLAEGKI